MTKITGEAIALISKYISFDPANPEKTEARDFIFADPGSLDENGNLGGCWAKDGYMYVGRAKIEVELLPQKEVLTHAVASLQKQKTQILADAQAAVTGIERQIQSLLAITNGA